MSQTCLQEGCTVDTTKICVLGNDPGQCPQRLTESDGTAPLLGDSDAASVGGEKDGASLAAESDEATALQSPPLHAPKSSKVKLPLGHQLSFPDLDMLSRQRPVRVIGILGPPDAGKTAALVSLYLLVANARLERFSFRNSESIFAFDQLASGARGWDGDGKMLEQLTAHTELEDPRRPSFLHLRLHSEKLGGPVDLAFPDLPGEWTDSLVDKSDHERLDFLKSAQVLWITVDGSALADPERSQGVVGRVRNVLARVSQFLDPEGQKPILLVVTRRDEIEEVPARAIEKIKAEATRRGLHMDVVEIASFSEEGRVEPGFGIERLLEESIIIPPPTIAVAALRVSRTASRQMLRHRSDA